MGTVVLKMITETEYSKGLSRTLLDFCEVSEITFNSKLIDFMSWGNLADH